MPSFFLRMEAAAAGIGVPVLLIVGSLDTEVKRLNEQVFRELECEKQMVIVEGATHLFEEPGKMEEVSKLAADWFAQHLQDEVTVNRKQQA